MAKIRVHELAKEFDIASKEMEARIKDMGFQIKNYMSTLEDYEVQEIRRRLKAETQAKDRENVSAKKIVRRRHKVVRIKKVVRVKKAEPGMEPDEQSRPLTSEPGHPDQEDIMAALSEDQKDQVQEKEVTEEEIVEPEASAAPPDAEESVTEASASVESTVEDVESDVESSEEEIPDETPEAGDSGTEEEETDNQVAQEVDSEEVIPFESSDSSRPVTAREKKQAAVEAPVESKKKSAQKREKGGAKQKSPRQFVKILDRVKIELPKTAKPARPSRPAKPDRPKKASGQTRAAGPPVTGPAPDSAASIPKSAKGRKKDKRVVQGSELGGGKRHKNVKQRWGKHKSIDRILAEEEGLLKGKKLGKGKQHLQPQGTVPIKAEKRKFAIYETIQPVEMAKKMGVKVSDIIMKLMTLGVMVTANQSIDYETAALIAGEFGYEIEKRAVAEDLVQMEDDKEGGKVEARPPVVTIMGHVDHGKTTLLDAIRRADVAGDEAGGITQHIGAYRVKLTSGSEVVFLDTPGHEAFTSMRARGAGITDIVILVVAADDGVMAQTKEAIDHSNVAGVPIIVAVNKIDKPGAEPDRVKRELAEIGLVPEDWGGDTIFVNISAKQGTGIEDLLDMMVLQAEVLELKADPNRRAKGHVIESRLDRGKGSVATLLVEEGTLIIGEAMVAGPYYGKVRAMIDDHGHPIKEAGPVTPVEIQGLSGVPEPGSEFVILENEKKAREVADYRQRKSREVDLVKGSVVSLENMFQKMEQDKLKVFNIVLKADVQGSLEAVTDSLKKLATNKIRMEVVRGGIGAITESDVLLAAASNAVILGFSVKPVPKAKVLAEQENVEVRFYDVIYHAIEEIKAAMVGMLEPVYREVDLGRAEVRDTFHITKVGTIAGCKVIEGVIRRNSQARLLRDNVVVYKGLIGSLKRFKDDVREVQAGYECGIGFDKFNDIKVGDVIEAYEMEEMAPDIGVSVAEQESAEDE